MYTALNGLNQIVHIDETIPNEHYVCPCCGGRVYPRGGDKICRHFYHRRNTCNDNWDYEIDDWHKEMQNCWPKENQERVIRFNGEVHRADVLVDDMVIEIQNSKMSAIEFRKRTSFFLNAGYKIAWIFNFTNAYINNRITRAIPIAKPADYTTEPLVAYRWSDPAKTFSYAPNVHQNDKFALWVWLDPNHSKLEKVSFMVKDDKKLYSMKYFRVLDREIDFEQPLDAAYFFDKPQIPIATTDTFAFVKHGQSYISPSERYVYIANMGSKEKYTCPRGRSMPWISIFGENGCQYCNGCKAIGKVKVKNGYGYKVMCDFANLPYHEAMNPYTKRERDPVPILDEATYIQYKNSVKQPLETKCISETSLHTEQKRPTWQQQLIEEIVARKKEEKV